MGGRRSTRRRLWQALAVSLIVGWLAFLRPTSLGGPASYMLVVGQSMEPTLAHGTLIISVSQPAYDVGDVVAFVPPPGHGGAPMVIHRLVSGSAEGGYLTRGDNNRANDPWTVSPGQVVGRPVLAVPGVGGALMALRSPLAVAAMTGLLATYALSGVLFPTRRQPQPQPQPQPVPAPVALSGSYIPLRVPAAGAG